eukprot:m.381883 g.381883  ORF g.381883 m.381883 type:complete len:878 (-) comp20045_c7_seq7:19-2652(-)
MGRDGRPHGAPNEPDGAPQTIANSAQGHDEVDGGNTTHTEAEAAPLSARRRAKSCLMVAVRIRPLSESEAALAATSVVSSLGDNVVSLEHNWSSSDVLRKNRSRTKRYSFDHVFPPRATQDNVFNHCSQWLLEGLLHGLNATVLAYGPTGAGKTYTMLGSETEQGLMYRMLAELFRLVERDNDTYTTTVTMSFVEIYNETLRDLLVEDSFDLDLREDGAGNSVVCGAETVEISCVDHVMQLLSEGGDRRTMEPTAANTHSSRSHAILDVGITRARKTKTLKQEVIVSKLLMTDLAGSERAAQTQNRGVRMVEGQHINRSLLALGNCINALANNQKPKYTNFRDSKLTRMLKESLGGNSRTVLIAHVSPASLHFDETYNTLNYANRAKNIKTKVVKNTRTVEAHISEYENMIAVLQAQIAAMETAASAAAPATSAAAPGFDGAVVVADGSGNRGQTSGPAARGPATAMCARCQQNVGIRATETDDREKAAFATVKGRVRRVFARQTKLQRQMLALQGDLSASVAARMAAAPASATTANAWVGGSDSAQRKGKDRDGSDSDTDADAVAAARAKAAATLGQLKRDMDQACTEGDRLADNATTALSSPDRLDLLRLMFDAHNLELRVTEAQVKLRRQAQTNRRLTACSDIKDDIIAEQSRLLQQGASTDSELLMRLRRQLASAEAGGGRTRHSDGAASQSSEVDQVVHQPRRRASTRMAKEDSDDDDDDDDDDDGAVKPVSPRRPPPLLPSPLGHTVADSQAVVEANAIRWTQRQLSTSPASPRRPSRGGGELLPRSVATGALAVPPPAMSASVEPQPDTTQLPQALLQALGEIAGLAHDVQTTCGHQVIGNQARQLCELVASVGHPTPQQKAAPRVGLFG